MHTIVFDNRVFFRNDMVSACPYYWRDDSRLYYGLSWNVLREYTDSNNACSYGPLARFSLHSNCIYRAYLIFHRSNDIQLAQIQIFAPGLDQRDNLRYMHPKFLLSVTHICIKVSLSCLQTSQRTIRMMFMSSPCIDCSACYVASPQVQLSVCSLAYWSGQNRQVLNCGKD